ncbi:unnamed protein product [Ostreobium quekettii]|uniref:3-hydroxyisobutyrate dehydrogenase n=1 Tax=Ostreobium quekettii TaxID=121088 RepID=A0A8S1JC07_9CHLO|nr:unnamed protein product [Ostreobium quekettii]
MAANLARAGFSVAGWNRTPGRPGAHVAADAGVSVVDSAEAAVRGAGIVFTCLGDEKDVEQLLAGPNGLCQLAAEGTLFCDTSTIGREAARRVGAELKGRGMRFVDAPVSGGDVGARSGTLTIMAGGEREDYEECLPCFEAMGRAVHLCGPLGSGQAVKMCNQVLFAGHMVALCEAMRLAEKQGLDQQLIVDVCSSGAAGSWVLSNLGMKVASADYAPGFMIKHMAKDLRLIAETAASVGEELPNTTLAWQKFQQVGEMDSGKGGELGTQGVALSYEKQ